MNRFLTIIMILLITAMPVWAKDASHNDRMPIAEIFNKIDSSLVTVEYKAEMNFMGRTDEIEGRVLGLVVEGNMVIFDGMSLGEGPGFGAELFGGPRVEKPKSIKVKDANGDEYEAEFIGVDDYSSIAFCYLPPSAKDKIKPLIFDETKLELGQDVYFMWLLPKNYQPRFQITQTMITSVLSKPEEYFLTGELSQDFLMCPIITEQGNVVGIVSMAGQAAFSPFDFGTVFGAPIGVMPYDKMQKLLKHPPAPDEFQRGWLGVSLQALDPEVAEFWDLDISGGIIITDILENTPAQKAGLRKGDFIVSINGDPIEVTQDENLPIFQQKISEFGAGKKVKLGYIRPGDDKSDSAEVEVVLAKRPIAPGDAPRYEDENFEMTVRDMVFADYNSRSLNEDEIKGVVVDKLESGGWAGVSGIKPGSLILKVNDSKVASVEEFKEIMAEIEESRDSETVFMAWRRNKTQFIHVKAHWK